MIRHTSRFLAAAALLIAAPAAASVTAQSDTGFVIALERAAPGAPADAWRQLIVPSAWWSSDHTWSGNAANLSIEARAGGCFCERLPASGGDGSVEHMRVVNATPGSLLRMVGGLGPLQSEPVVGVLSISLRPDGSGTRISWEYAVSGAMRMKPAELAPLVERVLGEQLDALALRLGRPGADGSSVDPQRAAP